MFFATAKTANADTCGIKFDGKCSCGYQEYDDGSYYVVNCTDQNFKNTKVLEYLPSQTEVVIFTGNYIPELPWNVFGSMNDLTNLSIIDMSNNHIREIRGKTYHHVTNVKRLILNHNNITIASDDDVINHLHPRVFSNFVNLMELHLTNAFSDNTSAELSEDLHYIFVESNLTKLVKLHLEQNEISKFNDRRVFCDIPNLRDLHLGDNMLIEINFNIICLKNLRFLDLERNKFTMLHEKDTMMLDSLNNLPGRDNPLTIDLSLNTFSCDCTILHLYDWLKRTNVTVRNKNYMTCFHNKVKADIITTINVNRCRLRTANSSQSSGHTVTLIFLLTILTFILIGLIVALIYVSKERLKTLVTPVFDSVSKKVHYTSIKDDADCPEQYV